MKTRVDNYCIEMMLSNSKIQVVDCKGVPWKRKLEILRQKYNDFIFMVVWKRVHDGKKNGVQVTRVHTEESLRRKNENI